MKKNFKLTRDELCFIISALHNAGLMYQDANEEDIAIANFELVNRFQEFMFWCDTHFDYVQVRIKNASF